MKKIILGILIAVGLFVQPVSAADVSDNFTIINYDVQMRLSRDSEQRSALVTTETITVNFPQFDQNHGLERAFVKSYNGHPTSFNLQSVTDEANRSLEYHWSEDNLRIGNADEYVRGVQTYKITYTQRDVMREYKDTNKAEFYWDAIGVQWQVPITRAHIQLEVDESLRGAVKTDLQCYQGVTGSSKTCAVASASTGQYEVSVTDLPPKEGVTIALGFTPGTFNAYEPSLLEKVVALWVAVQGLTGLLALGLIIWLTVKVIRSNSRRNEMSTIVTEFLPPKDISVTTAATLITTPKSTMTAQLLDLTVRHYIKLYEVKEKTLFRPAEYEIEVIKDIKGLKWEEQELLRDTFGHTPTIGAKLNLKELKNNVPYYKRTLNNDSDLVKLIRGKYGLRHENKHMKSWMRRTALVILLVAVLTLSIPLAVASLIAFICSFTVWQLTDKGLAAARYLQGLKRYISVAEEERLRLLQSPEGAKKIAEIGAADKEKVRIVLYEKVLPYAALFGQEKEWNKQLGSYYEQSNTQPDWYVGHSGVFNAAAFSAGLNGLSSTTATASSSSSSSGGSSGGGSSGGGGGGGGGGGW